jgi:hypothetical protein
MRIIGHPIWQSALSIGDGSGIPIFISSQKATFPGNFPSFSPLFGQFLPDFAEKSVIASFTKTSLNESSRFSTTSYQILLNPDKTWT